MGVVYEAEHLAMGKVVAVKVLHPSHAQDRDAVSRLRHEARVAGTLGHPNICAIYDMGWLDDGSPYLVLERLHGETLAQRLMSGGRLPHAEMIEIMLQVLSALAAVHQRGVVHRDLKPENIFLARRDVGRPIPKLLDFGISRADDIEDTMADPTGALLAAGTPFYMAPEQARGDRQFDARVDIWSAGVVLYEGLTGQRPFQAKNYNALLVEILSMTPRPLRDHDPSLSSGLSRVVEKALAKRPEERYLSALDFQSELRTHEATEEEASHQVVPILVNEQTTDDVDATHVFSRLDMAALGAQRAASAAAAAAAEEDEQTPIYAPDGVIEDERTVIDPPTFGNDTVTQIRRDQRDPGRKR